MKIASDEELEQLISGKCEPCTPLWFKARDFFFAVEKNGEMPDQNNPHYAGLDRCWGWNGKTLQGYAMMNIEGNLRGAHRFSYSFFKKEIPDGMIVMHKCDNKVCTNPEHLEIGTRIQNTQDAHKRGLVKRGKSNSTTVKDFKLPFLIMAEVVNSLNRHTEKINSEDRRIRLVALRGFHAEIKKLLTDCFAIAYPDRKFLRPREAKNRIQSIQPFSFEEDESLLDCWMEEIDDERNY